MSIAEMIAALEEAETAESSTSHENNRTAPQEVRLDISAPAESRSALADANSEVDGKYGLPEDIEERKVRLATWSDADLVDTLERLSNSRHRHTGEILAYEGDVRSWLFAINTELNERGRLAPRFRNLRRPQRLGASVGDLNLSCDRQVIDLHWLHCREEKRKIQKKEYRDLLSRKTFDFDLACKFAAEPTTSDTKATWLNVHDDILWQLAAIQPKQFRDKDRDLVNGRYENKRLVRIGQPQVRTLLELALRNKPQNLRYIDDWVTLWRCEKMVGNDPSRLAELHTLATGRETQLSRTTIKSKLDAIQGHLNTGKKLSKYLPSDEA